MDNIINFVDEKNTRKIVNALCSLDYLAFNKIVNDSGISVIRLLSFIDGSERITMLEKGQLIPHLIKLADIDDDSAQIDEETAQTFSTFKDFLKNKTLEN
jgi:hypothetical protein